jgi:hypothetical protein
MKIAERMQAVIHAMEVGKYSRWVQFLALAVMVFALAFFYDITSYRNFSSPEAMDAAQVARNLAEGKGYSTGFIRPFSVHLLQEHHRKQPGMTNALQLAGMAGPHPDLANAPVYPTLLAGFFKIFPAYWSVDLKSRFWSEGGRFQRYPPEFAIAVFNQFLLLVVVFLTYQLARRWFETQVAVLSALVLLCGDALWRFSVSGLSTMLLLAVFLALIWSLTWLEEEGRMPLPRFKRLLQLSVLAGALAGVGMLTRYSFGWVVLPVIVFISMFGGFKRGWLLLAMISAFGLVTSPWLIRNYLTSGTLFGTAGYAVLEGTFVFPGTQLMQSLNPDMLSAYWTRPYLRKLVENSRYLLQGDVLRVAGGWVSILFFAGLMLAMPKAAPRRFRGFTLICLGIFIVVQALGRTEISNISPEINTENLLVLLTPLVVVFAMAAFMKLLDLLATPSPEVRLGMTVVALIACCHPLFLNFLPPRVSPVAYPPYYPPDIQKFSGWMKSDELVMSDIPWAVAWYGERKSLWITKNAGEEFYEFSDNIKHVSALYLTLNTLDAKLYTGCLTGGADNWSGFVFKMLAMNQLPTGFPLQVFPYPSLSSGFFLTDRVRWETK